MKLATAYRAPELGVERLGMLTLQLQAHAGMTIDSTKNVIADCIGTRMEYLSVIGGWARE